MNNIKILVVEPNKEPYEKIIKNTLDSIYGLVYYPYQQIEIDKNVYLIYSKEAESNNFPICRKLKELKIYSNFVVIKKENNKFVSLNDIELKKYIKMFQLRDKI